MHPNTAVLFDRGTLGGLRSVDVTEIAVFDSALQKHVENLIAALIVIQRRIVEKNNRTQTKRLRLVQRGRQAAHFAADNLPILRRLRIVHPSSRAADSDIFHGNSAVMDKRKRIKTMLLKEAFNFFFACSTNNRGCP